MCTHIYFFFFRNTLCYQLTYYIYICKKVDFINFFIERYIFTLKGFWAVKSDFPRHSLKQDHITVEIFWESWFQEKLSLHTNCSLSGYAWYQKWFSFDSVLKRRVQSEKVLRYRTFSKRPLFCLVFTFIHLIAINDLADGIPPIYHRV